MHCGLVEKDRILNVDRIADNNRISSNRKNRVTDGGAETEECTHWNVPSKSCLTRLQVVKKTAWQVGKKTALMVVWEYRIVDGMRRPHW